MVVHALYDAWTPGPRLSPHPRRRARPHRVRVRAAWPRPIEVKFERAGGRASATTRSARSWNFPAPWPGGTWRLRDIVDYQLSATRALLDHAARNRDYWLRTFLEVNRRAAARREPLRVRDPGRAEGSAGHRAAAAGAAHGRGRGPPRAEAPFEAGGPRASPPGAHVVLMAQPFSAFAKSLLERQQLSRPPAVPGRPAAAALRRHRAHAAPADGRRRGRRARAVPRRARAGDGGARGARPGRRARPLAGARPQDRRPRGAGPAAAGGRRRALGHGARSPTDGRRFARRHAAGARRRRAPKLEALARELGVVARRCRAPPRRPAPAHARASACTSPGSPRWTRAGRASSSSTRWASTTRRCTTRTCGRATLRDALRRDRAAGPERRRDRQRPRAGRAAARSTRAASARRASRRSRRSSKRAARWSRSTAPPSCRWPTSASP